MESWYILAGVAIWLLVFHAINVLGERKRKRD